MGGFFPTMAGTLGAFVGGVGGGGMGYLMSDNLARKGCVSMAFHDSGCISVSGTVGGAVLGAKGAITMVGGDK